MTKLCIFDLDGTLINSLSDLAGAMNHALEKNGFAPHETEKYRMMVGSGAAVLAERAMNTDSPDSCELSIQGRLFVCWQELYNLHLSKLSETPEDNSLSKNLIRSMDYMQEHYQEALTLSLLAGISGYSESYYCHNFSTFTGSTPFEYLNRIRIVKACELLNSSDKKITDIASLVGYNNISYFNRTFVKIMGFTPSSYRKN